MRVVLPLLFLAAAPALAQEGELTGLSYNGQLAERKPDVGPEAPIAITHAGGRISVRCADTTSISARLDYTIEGTSEPSMEAFGRGLGLAVWGDAAGGGVKSRIPAKGSGVSSVDLPLTVTVPKGARLTITGGKGPVEVLKCEGRVSASNTDGEVFVQGTLAAVKVAANGDARVKLDEASVLAADSSVTSAKGNVQLAIPVATNAKLSARGTSVSVFQPVSGSTTPTAVTGTLGVGGPALTVKAAGTVEITAP